MRPLVRYPKDDGLIKTVNNTVSYGFFIIHAKESKNLYFLLCIGNNIFFYVGVLLLNIKPTVLIVFLGLGMNPNYILNFIEFEFNGRNFY